MEKLETSLESIIDKIDEKIFGFNLSVLSNDPYNKKYSFLSGDSYEIINEYAQKQIKDSIASIGMKGNLSKYIKQGIKIINENNLIHVEEFLYLIEKTNKVYLTIITQYLQDKKTIYDFPLKFLKDIKQFQKFFYKMSKKQDLELKSSITNKQIMNLEKELNKKKPKISKFTRKKVLIKDLNYL
jgi:hypothetical protein